IHPGALLVDGPSMFSPVRRAVAAACMLSAATAFIAPAPGPHCPIPSAFPKTRRISAAAAAVSSPRFAGQGQTLVMVATPVVKRVAIVGAGVGGLTLANALCKGDMAVEEVKVFEKFDSVKPGIGGGVQINSGAVTLARLGLGDAVKAGGNQVDRILSRTVKGRVILDLDVGKMVRSDPKRKSMMIDDGTPMLFTIMRDRLMQILADGLPRGVVKTKREVVAVEESPSGATLRFGDGSTEGPFDLVVGADGIKGAARKAVKNARGEAGSGGGSGGGEDGAIYSGIRIQYGVAPAGQRPKGSEREVHQWFGGDTYGLSATYQGIGNKKFEMVAAVYQDRDRTEENAVWDQVEAKGACLRRLDENGFPREMRALAEASDRFYELGVYYRNPLEGWVSRGEGQVVLLGDAAHAMPPNLGQGANQAIQDAYCLAERLAELNRGAPAYEGSLITALQAYERARKPDTALVLAKSVLVGAVETL
ncbi:unnamed protein product, partial [Scytosiphon promiscuus]